MNPGRSGGSGEYPLLSVVVVTGLTTYMIYPLLTLALLGRGLNAGAAGLVLGILSGVGPLCSSPSGYLIARYGSKVMAILGLFLRAVGLSVFIFNVPVPVYALFAAVASLGSGAAGLAVKTELMRQSTSRKMVTMRSIAVNSGALIGPAIGAGLYNWFSFDTVVVVSCASYVLLGLCLLALPFKRPEGVPARRGPVFDVGRMKGRLLQGRGFLLLLLLTMIYWLVYAQWSLVVPMSSYAGFGSKTSSNAIYIGNAVFILILQYPLLVHGLKKLRDTSILLLGFGCFVPAFSILFLHAQPAVAIGFAAAFSLGELLISPTLDLVTGKMQTEGSGLTRAYGWTGTVSGLASLIGSSLGGYLIQVAGGVRGASYLCVPLAIMALPVILSLRRKDETL